MGYSQSMGSQRLEHDLMTNRHHIHLDSVTRVPAEACPSPPKSPPALVFTAIVSGAEALSVQTGLHSFGEMPGSTTEDQLRFSLSGLV